MHLRSREVRVGSSEVAVALEGDEETAWKSEEEVQHMSRSRTSAAAAAAATFSSG